jgi:hypothetical protein
METVGWVVSVIGAGRTVTVVFPETEPPLPVHETLYDVVVVSGAVTKLPCVPERPVEVVQEVLFVLLQEMTEVAL